MMRCFSQRSSRNRTSSVPSYACEKRSNAARFVATSSAWTEIVQPVKRWCVRFAIGDLAEWANQTGSRLLSAVLSATPDPISKALALYQKDGADGTPAG